MKPENRAVWATGLVVVVVIAVVGAFLLTTSATPPTTLPILAGTAFNANESLDWVAHFTVGPSGGTLTGAWTAYQGWGFVSLILVNGTVSKPPVNVYMCPLLHSWAESNGSIDRALLPGPYTVYWDQGFCAGASQIVVTQTIQVVPS